MNPFLLFLVDNNLLNFWRVEEVISRDVHVSESIEIREQHSLVGLNNSEEEYGLKAGSSSCAMSL